MAVRALAQTLNYRLCLASKPANSLVGLAMAEMTDMASQGLHCWLTRTDKMARLLNLPDIRYSKFFGQMFLRKYSVGWIDIGWMKFHQPELVLMVTSTIIC